MDRPDSSSSDDRQNLIEQNESKQLPSPRSTTTFHIDDGDVDCHRHHREIRLRFASLKRFLIFFIFIPLFVFILFFTIDIKSLFFSRLSVPLSDKLRESELQALFLLRQKQLGLFGLWNQTHPNSTSNHSNSKLQDFKSSILRQISLNKDIQQVLLAPHSSGNSSKSEDFFRDLSLSDRCGVVD